MRKNKKGENVAVRKRISSIVSLSMDDAAGLINFKDSGYEQPDTIYRTPQRIKEKRLALKTGKQYAGTSMPYKSVRR